MTTHRPHIVVLGGGYAGVLAANHLLQNPAVDDVTERETSPPYPFPLRGIQITLRIIDPDSRQSRQITVVNDFTPE